MAKRIVPAMNGLNEVMSDSHPCHLTTMSLPDLQEKSTPPSKRQKTKHHKESIDEVNHPAEVLSRRAATWNCEVTSAEFPKKMDAEDPLRHLRDQFHFPKSIDLPKVDSRLVSEDEECVYFCGNSLGLMPKSTPACVNRELDKWAKMGEHGRCNGHMPWALCDDFLQKDMAKLVGAKSEEVGLMNGLTVNLHLLMISFYEPTPTRHKIVIESKAFPSDHYAVESQIRLKGYDPATSMICMKPREGEFILRHEDIISFLDKEGDSIALVLLPSVHYYTGQLFDMKTITKVAQSKGCLVGFDLAHAVGNVPVYLHEWGVDFACWCTYKYLCSGAGGIAGAFIHEKHANSKRFRLTGWWSHKKDTRFDMSNEMDLAPGIAGYRISNPPPLLCAPLEASLKVYNQTTMEDLRAKSLLLTGYLELLLKHYYPKPAEQQLQTANGQDSESSNEHAEPYVELITPDDPAQRGCQLSAIFSVPVTEVFQALQRRGVVLDHRKPYVLRLAPIHLYNSFYDVYRFVMTLGDAMREAKINAYKNGHVVEK